MLSPSKLVKMASSRRSRRSVRWFRPGGHHRPSCRRRNIYWPSCRVQPGLPAAAPVGAGLVVTCLRSGVTALALIKSTRLGRVSTCRWRRLTASCSFIGARARSPIGLITAGASRCVSAIPGAGSVLGR